MTFRRPPATDDAHWPRASAWLGGQADLPLVEVVGVPTSIGSISPSRAFTTPAAVRDALRRLSPYDPVTGVDLSVAAPARDAGDWPVADLDLGAMVDDVARRARGLREQAADGRTPVRVFLGGDNAITRPLVSGLFGPDLDDVGLLTLDAHHDVRTLDDGPRNGTPVRGLIQEEGLPGRNVAQVGIGAFTNSANYRAWCDDQGIHVTTADEVHDLGIDVCLAAALGQLAHCRTIYVDLDVDVLDVAFAPACPGARPGGLTPGQFLTAARLLGRESRVAAVDLVEVDAEADHDGRTVMVTAMGVLAVAAGVALRP